ncbi:MAG: porin [Pseudomonadota bacterium]
MMKKILAVAVASAFAAPAFAATSNVDIYGQFHVSIDSLDDGTNSGTNVSSNASNIGFRGTEDLGGGLSAIWQVESLLSVDGTGDLGSSRDTFAGLKGGFGTLRVGYFDTPMKQVSRTLDFFNNKIGDTRNLMGGATSNWEARFNNGVRYDTPDMSGFSASVHYSTQYGAGVGAAVTNNDNDAYALGLNYKNGPFLLMAAYQTADIAGSAAGDESAWRLGAGVKLGDITLNALYHSASDQAGVVNADRKVYGLGAGYKMGNIGLAAQWYKATDLKGNATPNQSADMFALGADYSFSKRTTAYVAYARTSNDANGTFSMAGGGHGDNISGITAGKDPDGFSLGMIHRF